MSPSVAFIVLLFIGYLVYRQVNKYKSKRNAAYNADKEVERQQEKVEEQERLERFPDRDPSTRTRVTKQFRDLELGDIVKTSITDENLVIIWETPTTTPDRSEDLKYRLVYGFTPIQDDLRRANLMNLDDASKSITSSRMRADREIVVYVKPVICGSSPHPGRL